jgi:hypothetical protein
LRHPSGATCRPEDAPLAAEGQQLFVAALAAAQSQQTERQDGALKEGVELVIEDRPEGRLPVGAYCGVLTFWWRPRRRL